MTVRARAVLAFALGLPCCVSILDLTDYTDAVASLCACGDVPNFNGACAQKLQERLQSVADDTRENWLETFKNNDCGNSCTFATVCYQQPGTCSVNSCSEADECCQAEGPRVCTNGTCTSSGGNECAGLTMPCNSVDDCCEDALSCTARLCTDITDPIGGAPVEP